MNVHGKEMVVVVVVVGEVFTRTHAHAQRTHTQRTHAQALTPCPCVMCCVAGTVHMPV